MSETVLPPSAPTGHLRTLLRLEALAVLIIAAATYFITGGNPWLFALLFFAPDLSFAAYTLGPKPGAIAYNSVHSYLLAAALFAFGWLAGQPLLTHLALILTAHIGFDRTFGYGLKYATAFNATHLGRIARK